MALSKFPARLWLLCQSGENLFHLSPDDLAIFKLLAESFYRDHTSF